MFAGFDGFELIPGDYIELPNGPNAIDDLRIEHSENTIYLFWTEPTGGPWTYNIYLTQDPYVVFPDEWDQIASGIEGSSWSTAINEDLLFYCITASDNIMNRKMVLIR